MSQKKMRVLQVVPHYVPAHQFGGPQRVAHNMSKTLSHLGHSVVVCTTNLATENSFLDVVTDEAVHLDGVTVYYESVSPLPYLNYYGFSPKLWRRASQEIARCDVVLVHFHYQFANWLGAYLARRYDKPYIIFPHGSFNKWGIANKGQWKKKTYLRMFEQANVKNALFVAFNASVEKQLSLFAERGVVIPNGIDPTEFESAPTYGSWRSKYPQLMNRTCILYLGRLNPSQKGLDMLLPAFARLLQERNDVHLILAGPDERGGETEVRRLVSSLDIDQNVTFTGLVAGVDKLAILRDSDVYTLVSPSEGMSIALLEAMYMGLPVVASDRIGLSDEIRSERAGIIVERDVEQISTALLEMVCNGEHRRQMGTNAHHLVARKYTWDIIAQQLISAIEERVK